jgi:hypothetical protein
MLFIKRMHSCCHHFGQNWRAAPQLNLLAAQVRMDKKAARRRQTEGGRGTFFLFPLKKEKEENQSFLLFFHVNGSILCMPGNHPTMLEDG